MMFLDKCSKVKKKKAAYILVFLSCLTCVWPRQCEPLMFSFTTEIFAVKILYFFSFHSDRKLIIAYSGNKKEMDLILAGFNLNIKVCFLITFNVRNAHVHVILLKLNEHITHILCVWSKMMKRSAFFN